jgi:arylsulfatase
LIEQRYHTEPAQQRANPHVVNLLTDPKERETYNPVNYHTRTMAHFGRMLKEFRASVEREPLIPAGAPLDFVPRAAPTSTPRAGRPPSSQPSTRRP